MDDSHSVDGERRAVIRQQAEQVLSGRGDLHEAGKGGGEVVVWCARHQGCPILVSLVVSNAVDVDESGDVNAVDVCSADQRESGEIRNVVDRLASVIDAQDECKNDALRFIAGPNGTCGVRRAWYLPKVTLNQL